MTGPSAIREQRERASVLKNEQKLREGEPQTFFARARAGLDTDDLPGGRYAAQQAHFPGEGSYPSAAGWTRDGVGLEPATGIAINALEPCGTPAEVQRSALAADQAATESLRPPDVSDDSVIGRHPPPAGVTPVSPVAREASSPADPTVASGSFPPASVSSPDVVDRGDEAVPARLAELLSSGLVRRPQIKRRKV